MLYNNFSSYLKTKYGGRISKICIDGGFGCPNRDGTCGMGGCIYCGERGAGEHIDPTLSIRDQVSSALAADQRSRGFIAYFQNFTNTYAPINILKERYDSALISDRIVALAIGTRPDCIDDEIATLLASYSDRVDVWVELGLQSASDRTAELINRGYKTEVYRRAADILKSHGIPFVTHMIIGLPGENETDIENTVSLINESAWGIKIHSIYVMEGTRLAEMYRDGEYIPPSREEYVRLAAKTIASLREDMIVHRITGDCPDGMLVAPEWNRDKSGIIEEIRKTLERDGLRQGSLVCK
ncbi:MAG: TIGR01212 family radical SAM protein [Clostridia bacterium]|nr:TIGR01212 family radical SAM protein [Clostridia bacterium]